jgi:hypothetical protein
MIAHWPGDDHKTFEAGIVAHMFYTFARRIHKILRYSSAQEAGITHRALADLRINLES